MLNVEETDRETKKMDMFFALCMTVEKGYLLAAKLLIDYGAPLDRLNEVDLKPLEIAILEEQEAMVSLLLSHNAPVNGFNRYGFTPLMISIIHDNPSAAPQLLWSRPGCAEIWRKSYRRTGRIEYEEGGNFPNNIFVEI
ncbi:unnamed protein product [Rodentolepis nana]|uniref:Uncharacterized protein n=1 Tax=Rodentolepis nana TaxID=102285 RepID=A0A3P7TYU9_RODNA|nr:unnamed protein product [Rodentolepis nana]